MAILVGLMPLQPEVNEAFASVPIAACRELGLDEEIVNVSGSGCSLGHPIAARARA